MPFPATKRLLIEAGYQYLTDKTCPCGARMELWRTPNGMSIPMNPMDSPDAEAESHFASCPKAEQFRRKRP
jgi:hypothetical protein